MPDAQPAEEPARRDDASPRPARTTRAEHREPVVLIATRQLQLRALGTTVLQTAGFRVETETRGEAIIANLAALEPDLILSDPSLEDMHASRLCARVRELTPGKTVPVLVISDQPDSPGIQKVLAEDFTDLVAAPVNWKVLTFRIHRWISMARKYGALAEDDLDLEQVRDSALKASTELLQLRNYDSVTGLPNREMFLSTVGLVLSQNRRSSGYSAVLYLDIDDFKGVNDLIGRSLGDELLRIIAKRLQGCLREGDVVSQGGEEASLTSFARLTGDQFAILLASVQDREAASAVAVRLLDSLARPILIRERQFRLAARIGISDSSQLEAEGEVDGEEEEILVQRAETAMRYCKQRTGKAFAFFESFMNEVVLKKLELKAELRQALDSEQLFLCYQLLVDSLTSTPTGVEGLVRWQHPTRGLVPPNDFLPVAEESDLIVEIDRWVLREGCRQGKEWLDKGYPPLLMSLNVSMRFLEEEGFAEQILSIVEESGLPPSSLQLELSERGTLPDAGRIMSQFELLVSKGVQLALDDFGTGQTSLSYLRTLPIRCVKVDQSFVRRVPDDSASVAIVTAIVAMSHHLGLKVVAEGVETANHWRFLAEKGYDQLQGYLFSRPEAVVELEQTFRKLGGRRLGAEGTWLRVLPSSAQEVAPPTPAARVRVPKTISATPFEAPPGAPQPGAPQPGAPQPGAPQPGAPQPLAPQPVAPQPRPVAAEVSAPSPAPSMEHSTGSHRHRVERDGRESGWNESEAHLLELARNDFLTGLHNRFSFDERLEHAVAHADRFDHRVAVMLIDLDDFKYVNDTHGHAVGDALLIAVADRLKNLVRKVDTLARIGGDEIAVILSQFQDVRHVAELARRLLSLLAQPVDVEGRELRVTGSLGVAVYPAANTQAKDLLRQADLALYKAKNQGGNCVRFFAREMDREVQQRLALARDLTGAADRGELFIEYQLQVALDTGSIVGVEALLRWDHPARGIIGPSRFIPIAESTGEIRSIGRWVIRSACEQAKRWQVAGRKVPVSVNLSPVQCRDSKFIETVLQALKEHQLAPELLDLELNERLLKHLPSGLEDSLRRLGDLGVSLTLDNFGSGPSALEHFQRFRFRRLKIHQSLVRTIGDRSVSASVLSGIVALASKMGVQIVAEGIEEPEEVEALLAEGCEVGQGFLFSKPMSADTVAEHIRRSETLHGFGHKAARPVAETEPAAPPDAGAAARAEDASPGAGVREPVSPETSEEPGPLGELLPSIDDLTTPEPPAPAATVAPAEPAAEPATEPAAEPAAEPATEPAAEPATEPAAEPPAARAPTPAPAVRAPLPPPAVHAPSPAPAAAAQHRARPRPSPSPAPARRAPRWRLHGVLAAAALVIWGFALWPGEIAIGSVGATAPAAAEEAASQQLVSLAQEWAASWNERRADDHLRLYASELRLPDGQTRDQWETRRRSQVVESVPIELELRGFVAESLGPERARVSFDQRLRGGGDDATTRKTLELVKHRGGWKIVAEH